MNGKYNRPLTLTDFLYLLAFFFGLNAILSIEFSSIYILYFVVTVSLLVDWTSAYTMSFNAGNLLLFSDIITVSNYICLYKALLFIVTTEITSYLRFCFHYLILFLIYFVWNVIVIRKNRVTNKTKKFFVLYYVVALIVMSICILFLILIYLNSISLNVCQVFIWSINGIHFLILVTWIIKTFILKQKEVVRKLEKRN